MEVGLNLKSGFIYNQLNEAPESSGWWGRSSKQLFFYMRQMQFDAMTNNNVVFANYWLLDLIFFWMHCYQTKLDKFHILMSIKYKLWVKAVSQACCLCWSSICKQHHSRFSLKRTPPPLCKHPYSSLKPLGTAVRCGVAVPGSNLVYFLFTSVNPNM